MRMIWGVSLYIKSSPTNSDGYEMIQLTAYILSNTIRRYIEEWQQWRAWALNFRNFDLY